MTTKTKKTAAPPTASRSATTPAAGGVTRTTMVVTPALAAEWLKSNTRNRSVNRPKVRRFAAEIAAGRWRLTHQGVAFGADEMLYDGQHRLLAIVEAGTAVEMEVTRGLPPSALDAIDYGGDTRSAADVLKIADGVDLSRRQKGNLMVAATLVADGNLHHPEVATPHSLRQVFAEFSAPLAAMEEVFGKGHGARVSPASVVGSLMVAWLSEPANTVKFARALRTGEALAAHHPALMLRNFLIDNDTARLGGIVAREALSLRTFAALDAFVRGDSLRQLKMNAGARDRYVAAWKRAAEG